MKRPARNHLDPRAMKARLTMRRLVENGFTDEQMLIDAAADAIDKPGCEGGRIIAAAVFAKHFKTYGAN